MGSFKVGRSLLTMAILCAAALPMKAGAIPMLVYAYSGDVSAGTPPLTPLHLRQEPANVPTPFTEGGGYATRTTDTGPYAMFSWSTAGDYATLGARETATAFNTPATLASASFGLGLSSLDIVTAVSRSGTLATGTPITLTLTLQVHGTDSFTSSANYTGSGGISAMAGAGTASEGISHPFRPMGSTSDTFDQTVTTSAVYYIGDPFFVSSAFSESVAASLTPFTSDTDTTSSVTLDYSHGVNFFLTASNPDVMLVAVSGHDYLMPLASSVPEPSTILLWTLPAATFVAWRRRSRTGHRMA